MTKQFNAYLLRFTSPLHLGNRRSDYSTSLTTLSSDGLYAALTACLAKYGETIPEDGDLGCVVSSLFPYWRKEKEDAPIFFLPKPLSLSLIDIKPEDLKRFKKIQWLDCKSFESIINGRTLFNSDSEQLTKSLNGSFLSSEFDGHILKSQVSERVQITSRKPEREKGEEPKPFYMDRISFAENSGLYFIADGNTEILEKALHYLSMEGLGTDRNVGNGYFEYEKQTIELEIPDSSDYIVSLSSLIPKSEEQLHQLLSDENIAYEIERRGGWITDDDKSIRKNVIYLFSAGSVFHKECNGVSILGKIVDLNPNLGTISHPVYRCGQAICLPIKLL